jgi:hypothetical protein
MLLDESFQIELPPYNQDLADAGKLASEAGRSSTPTTPRWRSGGNMEGGNPPLETGAIAADYDYLHIINWEKAEQVVADGKYEMHNGVRMIRSTPPSRRDPAHFAPEPRNPHGVDVSPDGNYIVVSGKLDPNVTVYSIDLIEQAIAENDSKAHDPFGVPILSLRLRRRGTGRGRRRSAAHPVRRGRQRLHQPVRGERRRPVDPRPARRRGESDAFQLEDKIPCTTTSATSSPPTATPSAPTAGTWSR